MNDPAENLQRLFIEACAKREPWPASDETGIRLDVSHDVYHRRELHTVSKSALDELNRSPAHYHAWLHGIEAADTPALVFGRAFHAALLEPEHFHRVYRTPPSFGDLRSSRNREARDAWLGENPGVTALHSDDAIRIQLMCASVMAHPAAGRLVREGQAEVTLRWRDPLTGLRCKSRCDYWVKAKRFAVDVKTTEDASPEAFARSVYKYRYHVQDALYRQGFAELGEPIKHFAILAVEKTPPYAVAVYTLDEDAIMKGYNSARGNILKLDECIRANTFPSYSQGVETLSLPPWAA